MHVPRVLALATAIACLPVAGVSSQAWHVVGIADFDGDGADDLAWRNLADGRNVTWPRAVATRAQSRPATGMSWQVGATGDYDGDGSEDLLWRDRARGTTVIWRSADPDSRLPAGPAPGIAWSIKS